MAIVPDPGRPRPSAPGGTTQGGPDPEAGEELAARVRQLAEGAAAPEDAFEPALRAVIEATGTAAGAICLYDQRHDLLRLAAEAGLSDEGCRRLRTVRKGDITTWDMPLHGMLNRRAYLIESAARNRYVPPLVEQANLVRTIACLPLHSGNTPLGSLILVSVAPQTFNERHIRMLEQPLREVVRLIEAVRSHANRGPAAAPAPAPAGGATTVPHRDLGAGSAAVASPAAKVAEIAERGPKALALALELAERDRSRLTATVEAAAAERAAQAEAFAAREQKLVTQHRAEIDRLRARVAEAEAGAAHEQKAREELEAALGRGVSAVHGDVQQARDAARRADAGRTAAVGEVARLAAELEQVRADVGRAEALAQALAAAEREQARLAAALEDATATRTRVERQDAAREAARVAEHDAELERLTARLQEAEAAIARERRAREAMESAVEHGLAERESDLRHAIEGTRAAEEARDAALGEVAGLRGEVARAQGHVEHLKDELARTAEDVQRLTAAEAALAAERAGLGQQVTELRSEMQQSAARLAERERELEALRVERAAEVASLSDEVAQVVGERNQVREAVTALETERARLVADLEGAAAARAHLEQAHTRALEEARAEARAEEARLAERERELEALRADQADVDALAARSQEVGAERDQLREAVAALEAERGHLLSEAEGTAAQRREFEESHARTLVEVREQAEAARRQLEMLRDEHGAAMASVTTHAEELVAERDQLREVLTALEGERTRLAEGASAAQASLEEARAHAFEEMQTLEHQTASRLAERERDLEALRTERTAEVAALTAECEQGHGRTAVLEKELELLRAERSAEEAALGARLDALMTERDQLREVVAALEAERAQLLAAEPAAAPAAAASSRSRPPAPAAPATRPAPTPATPAPGASARAGLRPPPPRPAAAEGDARHIAVLDGNPAWEAASPNGHRISVVDPAQGLGARLGQLGAGRIVVNLAHPGTLGALTELRAEGSSARFWGCIADPTSGRALVLGMIEPATRPLDPDAVMASLGAYATRGTRVVTVGADVDALVSLRQALARAGVSVSMAWDAKQAADLLTMVKPDVLVVDLGLPTRDACGIVARLSAINPVPHAVLIPGAADSAQGFAAALADPRNAQRALPLAQVLIRVAGGTERPPDRRP